MINLVIFDPHQKAWKPHGLTKRLNEYYLKWVSSSNNEFYLKLVSSQLRTDVCSCFCRFCFFVISVSAIYSYIYISYLHAPNKYHLSKAGHNFCVCNKITSYLCHLGPIGKLPYWKRTLLSDYFVRGRVTKLNIFHVLCYLFHLRRFGKLLNWARLLCPRLTWPGPYIWLGTLI